MPPPRRTPRSPRGLNHQSRRSSGSSCRLPCKSHIPCTRTSHNANRTGRRCTMADTSPPPCRSRALTRKRKSRSRGICTVRSGRPGWPGRKSPGRSHGSHLPRCLMCTSGPERAEASCRSRSPCTCTDHNAPRTPRRNRTLGTLQRRCRRLLSACTAGPARRNRRLNTCIASSGLHSSPRSTTTDTGGRWNPLRRKMCSRRSGSFCICTTRNEHATDPARKKAGSLHTTRHHWRWSCKRSPRQRWRQQR